MTSTIFAGRTGAVRPILALAAALLTLGASGAALADHPERLDGTVKVVNERMSPVTLAIDGRTIGRLPPGAAQAFHAVPNGVRLLRVTGPHAPPLLARVTVPIDRTVTYRVEALTGSAAVFNDSGVTMRVSVDGRVVGQLPPGGRADVDRLRAGDHELVAHPVGRSGPHLRQTLSIRAGELAKVSTGRWLAALEVTNTARRPARLFVDGAPVRRLRPGESAALADLSPGLHRVELRSRHRSLAETTVKLAPGERGAWQPRFAFTGDLRVSNDSRRPARVDLDGRHLARLGAGESRTFEDLPVGLHTLTAHYPRGRSETWTVRVEDGALARLSMHPGRGPDDGRLAAHTPIHRH